MMTITYEARLWVDGNAPQLLDHYTRALSAHPWLRLRSAAHRDTWPGEVLVLQVDVGGERTESEARDALDEMRDAAPVGGVAGQTTGLVEDFTQQVVVTTAQGVGEKVGAVAAGVGASLPWVAIALVAIAVVYVARLVKG